FVRTAYVEEVDGAGLAHQGVQVVYADARHGALAYRHGRRRRWTRRRVVSADRARRILRNAQLAEPHRQGVNEEEPAYERLAEPQHPLDGLGGLHGAEQPRQHAEDATLGAGRDEVRRRRARKEAAVTRSLRGAEHADLSFELADRGVDDRLPV